MIRLSTQRHTALVVGNIEDLACPSKCYSLTRQNETFPVKILMDLHAGDKLTLIENKSSLSACREKITSETMVLSVDLNGKPNQAIKYSELPYTVPAGSAITTTSDNLLSQLSSWITQQNDEQFKQQKRLVSLTSKAGGNEKFRIAVLEGNKGIWRFEAIQQITPYVEKCASVRILREVLLQNKEISPMDLMAKDCNN